MLVTLRIAERVEQLIRGDSAGDTGPGALKLLAGPQVERQRSKGAVAEAQDEACELLRCELRALLSGEESHRRHVFRRIVPDRGLARFAPLSRLGLGAHDHLSTDAVPFVQGVAEWFEPVAVVLDDPLPIALEPLDARDDLQTAAGIE